MFQDNQRPDQLNFALSTRWEVRTNPQRKRRIPTNLSQRHFQQAT